MDISGILQRVDVLYSENKGAEAERLMQEAISVAVEEQDSASLLQLLNELLGYYRETSQVENSYVVAEQAIAVAAGMGLEDSIPYATTLLNVANAYRAGGRLEDSLGHYLRVREIYERLLEPDNMLAASLENNISLLYQEMGDFAQAKACLLKALSIVKAKEAAFEVAVTYANLAGTCMQLNEWEEAHTYANLAIDGFRKLEVRDAHYGAALSALGTYYYRTGDYRAAGEAFKNAMEIMEQNLGRNDYYYRLKENYEACMAKMPAADNGGGQVPSRESTGKGASEAPSRESAGKEVGEVSERNEKFSSRETHQSGLALCREYYETYGKPMIEEKFAAYADKIAVGLVGEGSDCFGYDDALSQDHDWGPDFCLWVTEETYAQIGEALQQAYEELPSEFKGYQRTHSAQGKGRRGVMTVSDFYRRLLQAGEYEEIDWRQVSDASLAAAVNGEVFRDEEGSFQAFREKLKQGYPESVRFLKLAESAAVFSQTGQYNYKRMQERGDMLTAAIMLGDCMKAAMKLQHYIEDAYPPHDKWLRRSLCGLENGRRLEEMLRSLQEMRCRAESRTRMEICQKGETIQETEAARKAEMTQGAGNSHSTEITHGTETTHEAEEQVYRLIEEIGAFFAEELYAANFISDVDPYLDAHTEELLQKSVLSAKSNEELVEQIAKLEFEAFDKVKNVGGRASCQNDWATFSIMRKSQYLTWNRTMLLQYLYDFYREYHRGHNLITEKYGRMMESTAHEEYDRIKEFFPTLSPEKKAIVEEIVKLQVGWMEEFSAKYPHLADNARSVHTYEDNLYNTSYETYLRGEISTYSDKMLELYGRYVVDCAQRGSNLAKEIMSISTRLYGYESLEAAEDFLRE